MSSFFEQVATDLRELQEQICSELSAADGLASFNTDRWSRDGGGGGVSRVLEEGDLFEKAGVNFSSVSGQLPTEVAAALPGPGREFRAAGVSLVLHPRSPMVPTTHANFRYFEKGEHAWFGGGADLTPTYLYRDDAVHFHRVFRDACERHSSVADYGCYKAWCDSYFALPHRGETRGVGGIFFDYLDGSGQSPTGEGQEKSLQPAVAAELETARAFALDAGRSFTSAYLPIADRRRGLEYGDDERRWQLQRRGRYVEFNLVYDRGTVFGLRTGGRVESILMSLPPLVRWDYDVTPARHSREAELVAALVPTDWLGSTADDDL